MLFFLFGLFFPVTGLYYYYTFRKVMRRGIVVNAKVIRMHKEWSAHGGSLNKLSYPIVCYTTKDGQEITIKLEYATSWETVRVGQTIRIVYAPENPKSATRYLPNLPKIFLWGSIVLAMIGIVLEWVI